MFSQALIDTGTVVANQVVETFNEKEGSLMNMNEGRFWNWKVSDFSEVSQYSQSSSLFERIYLKFVMLLRMALIYATVSILVSIAIRIAAITFAVFYIIFSTISHVYYYS